jgi:hypothetical protein
MPLFHEHEAVGQALVTGSNQIVLGTATEMTYAMGGLKLPSGKN